MISFISTANVTPSSNSFGICRDISFPRKTIHSKKTSTSTDNDTKFGEIEKCDMNIDLGIGPGKGILGDLPVDTMNYENSFKDNEQKDAAFKYHMKNLYLESQKALLRVFRMPVINVKDVQCRKNASIMNK